MERKAGQLAWRSTVEAVASLKRRPGAIDTVASGTTRETVISCGIIRDWRALPVDPSMARAAGGDPVKVMSRHEAERGYAAQVDRDAIRMTSD